MTAEFTINVGTVTMHYRAWGDPESPALILLHGSGSSGMAWQQLGPTLANDWRVYAPDARGHGDTDWPGGYSFEAMADDLAGFVANLALRRPVLVGHSMGGVAAYLCAQRHPDVPSALVLAETPPPMPVNRPLPPRPDSPLPYDWDVRPAIIAELAAPKPQWWDDLAGISVPTLVLGGGPDSPFSQQAMARVAQ
ncbi:MAG: alpha/beta fold hydrolase [Stackebrandtia sp.]